MKCGPEELRRRIAVAAGGEPADLVIRNVTSFSLSSGELLAGDIAIVGDVIAGIGPGCRGERELDGAGSVVVPGFIDSHCHVESTLLTPFEFERLALAHGVTTAVCDPHELANVAGAAAVEWFLASAERLRMSLFVQIPSCVPATCLETGGAELSAEAIAKFRRAERSLGLAEMMNVPGVLGGDPGVLAKLALWAGANIDGHAPLLTGRPLDGVLAAGIRNCHECSRLEEAREKLARGMTVLIREGSAARNLEALAPLLTVANSPFLAFCCDDRNSLDWRREGGVDFMVRRALALGCEPLAVYRAASWSAARAFGLADRGLVAPGQRADLVLVDALESGSVRQVVCGGVPVSEELLAAAEPPPVPEAFAHTVRLEPVTEKDFRIVSQNPETPGKFYAQAQARGEAGIREISQRIQQMCTVTRADVMAVLIALEDVVAEALTNGEIVRLGELGSLQVSLSGEGSEDAESFNDSLIKKAKILFRGGKTLQNAMTTLKYEQVEQKYAKKEETEEPLP